jgi:hypothetical protein
MQPQPRPVDAVPLGRDGRRGEIGIGTGIGRYRVEGGEGWYPPPELRLPELWLDEPWLDDEWPLE